LGFKAAIVEGAKPVLGWRSPDMLYSNAIHPEFKLLMRNRKICDEIMSCPGETDRELLRTMPARLVSRLENTEPGEQVTNLYLDFALLGTVHPAETGVFTFMETFLSAIAQSEHLQFTTPSETAKTYPPASLVSVPHPVSWAADDRDIAVWTGNDLQQEALNQLYSLAPRILECGHQGLIYDWNILQASDYFYYMSMLFYDKEVTNRPNPYKTAHEAFVNYMNIVSDIKLRLH
jgi:alpha-amylase